MGPHQLRDRGIPGRPGVEDLVSEGPCTADEGVDVDTEERRRKQAHGGQHREAPADVGWNRQRVDSLRGGQGAQRPLFGVGDEDEVTGPVEPVGAFRLRTLAACETLVPPRWGSYRGCGWRNSVTVLHSCFPLGAQRKSPPAFLSIQSRGLCTLSRCRARHLDLTGREGGFFKMRRAAP